MGQPVTRPTVVIACLIAGLLGAALAVGVSYFFVTPKPVERSISTVSGSVDDLSVSIDDATSSIDDLSNTVSNVCDQFTSITC